MSGKEKFHGLGRGATAGQKRNQQLQSWEKSATNKEPAHVSSSRLQPRVRFAESVVFLAACQSGDVEEVERLLSEEKADINSVNKDGLTALHQCCIDDDYETVQLLVEKGANLDSHDNEGWTPLHAAASCGHDHIVSFLLDNGAFPAPVNNEGDTPCDLVEDDVIRDLITDVIHKQGVDVSDVKTEEERLMLADANRLQNDPSLSPVLSPGGATVLHVAAAKNYLEVLEVLLSQQTMVNNIDSRDEDGWTALHAAVYWENMEAAVMLVKKGASINLVTKTGDTIDDLCRPEFEDELTELKELGEKATRNRCYAVNHHKRPTLLHQSSRDEVNGGKPSPTGLRRRTSRDRSMFPKIDMASEKAMIEKWTPPEVADGHRGLEGSQDIEVLEEKAKNSSESHSHSENNVKEVVNSMKDREMTESGTLAALPSSKPPLPPGSSPQTSPQVQPKAESSSNDGRLTSPQASPKTAIKRRAMSGEMMKRVGLWEQHSTTNLNPPTFAASSSPSGSASSSPQHTPQTTPPETTKNPHDSQPKRFPFVQRSVSSTKGDERLKVTGNVGGKRNSYDETRLASSLSQNETSSSVSKTSSLPRNSRMVMEPQTLPSGNIADGGEVTVTTTEAMPTQSVPTETGVPRGGEGAKVERELSRAESVESFRSDRSFTEESETNRKRKAKKSRETRKKTQPVPADLFQQLSQMEEGGREGEKVKQEVERERKQFVEQLTSAAQDSAALVLLVRRNRVHTDLVPDLPLASDMKPHPPNLRLPLLPTSPSNPNLLPTETWS
ncbi:Protein phosphatase 1 regulatory subunit 12A [Geodia barretti]|uniref:Protein phosphatase 1 regulatory subunit 12A n=1 Tax=Geodia barretti TaxID=519541 RepID=A0AA35XAZ9_GEOBA|nr:Protein phosphatase 1 regulatory subunit 12A [Geodia barretti]